MQSKSSLLPRIWNTWRDAFSIDLRSLAIFRMGVAATLLFNLATRSRDLTAMYTDGGFIPLDAWSFLFGEPTFWSIHALRGDTNFAALVFAIHAILGLLLLVGWHARPVSFLAWLLLVSLHHRNPILISGGDVLLSMLLFWGIFLPTDACWSVATWRRQRPAYPPRYFSAATCGAMLQVFTMYFVTGLSKCNEIWWNGDALFHVFHYGLIVRPLGIVMLQAPLLLYVLTIAALILELVAPWCLLITKFQYRLRMLAIVSLVALHLGIEITMHVLIFSWVSMSGLMLFVPTAFWEWSVVRRFARATVASAPQDQGSRVAQVVGRRLTLAISIAAVGYSIVYNLLFVSHVTPGPWVERAGATFGWTQQWNMFSEPGGDEFRFAAVATLPNGKIVDILHDGQPVEIERPSSIEPRAASQRWMLTLLHLTRGQHAKFKPHVARYLLRRWNATHAESEQVDLVDLIVVVTPIDAASGGTEILRLAQIDRLSSGAYDEGEPDGRWIFRHRNGTKSAEGDFDRGFKVGRWTTWYPTGKIESRGSYWNDLLDGPWEFYDEQGTCVRELYDEGGYVSELPAQDSEQQEAVDAAVISPANGS